MIIKHGLLMAGIVAAAALTLPAAAATANMETGAQAPRIDAPDWKVLPRDFGLLTDEERAGFQARFDAAKTFVERRLVLREMTEAIEKAREKRMERRLLLQGG